MKFYYIYNPNGFANEYFVISVDQKNEKEKTAWTKFAERVNNDPNGKAYRITRKEAYETTAHNRKIRKDARRYGIWVSTGAIDIIPAKDILIF